MLSQAQRTTILELHAKGVSKREIARVLGISRPTVRKVLRSKATEVPELRRPEKAEPYRDSILELFSSCKGNLVRVHEELVASGAERLVSGIDGVLPAARHRPSAGGRGRPLPFPAGRRGSARYFSA